MRDLARPSLSAPEPPKGLEASAVVPARFSLDDIPDHERPALFRNILGHKLACCGVKALRNLLHCELVLRILPGLTMVRGRIGAGNPRAIELEAVKGSDDIGLIVGLRGRHVVKHSGGELVLDGGDATIVPFGEVASYMHLPPGDVLALRVPRAQIEALAPGVTELFFRPIPRDTEALKLLLNYAATTVNEETAGSPEIQHLMVNQVYELLAVVLSAVRGADETAPGRSVHTVRLQAVKADIVRNLDRSDLTVNMLADRHNCTPRVLQRFFEAEGTTFTEYVLGQRLARAHRRLTDPRRTHEKISAVAYECGFNDVSYFNRAFRRQYGAAPSDIRAQAQGGTAQVEAVEA